MMEGNNKQNILKLQRTVRFFEALLRASPDGIVITDAARNIIFVNDTFCKYFSCKRQDVIETNILVWLEKQSNNANDIWKELESQIQKNGIARDVEFRMKIDSGMRYFTLNSSLLEQVDIEEPGLIISIWRDVTRRKLAENELKNAHDELEMRVEDRTTELSRRNSQLRILSRAAQKINTVLEIPVILQNLIVSAMEITDSTAGTAGLIVNEKMVFSEYNEHGKLFPIDFVFEKGYGVPGM